jgi:hypothetical protein
VASETTVSVTGRYDRVDLIGGGIGTEPGQFNQPRGMAVDALHRLYVADSFNDRIQLYDPLTSKWSVTGQLGSAKGQFNKPFSVAVDTNFFVYVADCNNNRIQRAPSLGGPWTEWGGYGTNAGKFNQPLDIAVDSMTNVYVADLYNNRVQKMDARLIWSVFISSGTTTGRVQSPRGVAVDTDGNVYVSDDGTQTNGQSRVQKFNRAGAYVGLLGSRDDALGGLRRPGGMTVVSGTNVFVADIDNSRAMQCITAPLTWLTVASSNLLKNAEAVAWDPRGRLYVADTMNNRVIAIPLTEDTKAGQPRATLAGASASLARGFTLYWQGKTGWLYAVQYATTLTGTVIWIDVPGCIGIPGYDGSMSISDPSVTGVNVRYYRILSY